MQVIGYFILLLLALYFLFIKPYLMARNIEIKVEGIRLSFEKGLSFKSFLLYVPLKEKTIHLFVSNGAIRPWDIKAGEFSLIEVSKAPPSDKPFDYDFGPLVKFASRLNLRVDKLYISTNQVLNGESLTLFIPTVESKKGKIHSTGWAQVYRIHHKDVNHIEVFLKQAHIEGKNLILDQAQVRSDLYNLSLSGVWKGKKGTFQAEGYIGPIERESFSLTKTNIKLSGSLSYTQIRASFSGYSQLLDIKNRREFRGLRLEGEYLWEWKGKNQLKGFITDGFTNAEVNYSLSDGILQMVFRGFPVDQRLLGINQSLSAVANGQLELDLKNKSLTLYAYSPTARFENQEVRGVSLRLSFNFQEVQRGNIEFSVSQPFLLSVEGSFYQRDFLGNVNLIGYKLKQEGASAVVSYNGSLRFQRGQVFSYGRGRLESLSLRDINLGNPSYDLLIEGDTYRVNLSGEGYSLSGGGSLKEKDFSGRLILEGLNLLYAGVSTESLKGKVDLKLKENKLWSSGRLEGRLLREKVSSWADVSFEIEQVGGGLRGNLRGNLRDINIFQFSYSKGSFEGKLDGQKIFFSFDLKDEIQGRGYYDFKEGSYTLKGSLKHTQGDLYVLSDYRLRGRNKDINLEVLGSGKYKNYAFPINARLQVSEEELKASVRGFTLREGIITLRVPNVKVYGSMERGSIEVEPLTVSIGQERLSTIEFQRGEYTAKSVSLKGRLYGVLDGWLDLSYEDSLRLSSEGTIDLSRLFSVIRSRVLADAEGRISYKLSYTDRLTLKASSEKITLRSRYLAMPLSGKLEVNFKDNKLSGSASLSGNERASILLSLQGDEKKAQLRFEATQLPILYRNDAIRANMFVSGKGLLSSDYRSLNIKGEFYTSGVLNVQRLNRGSGASPEDYKRVSLDLFIASSEPLRINLPEGYVYADLSAKIGGTLYEPNYTVNAYLKGGALRYFEREFYVRRGELTLTNKDSQMDLTILTPTPDYSIIIDLKGNPQYPKVIVRSEPPRDTREVLTALVLGGGEAEGLIPVGSALISQIPQISGLLKGANRATGLDIRVQISPSVSPTGEVGLNATISKDLTPRITVEHRQSTLKNPRETYTGGDVKLTSNTSIGGRYYSDRTQEVRVRLRRKFDF
ncbi:MAG: translocation/assembly module TamB domain-containing protein [Aquificaceae bacterium]